MERAKREAVGATGGWPADTADMEGAREFLGRAAGGRIVIACDSDVDGLAGAVILERALVAHSAAPRVLPVRRGEHIHHPSMQKRIAELDPAAVIVVDMGSRPDPLGMGRPVLIVDHHDASAGTPPDALVVNGYDRAPVAPSSVLAYLVSHPLLDDGRAAWLAALGAIADLGSAASFASALQIRATGSRWRQAAALLNAARRAPVPDADTALTLLREATSVEDVVSGRLPQTAVLEGYREQVRAETERCARIAPAIAGNVALIRFSSGAQVHPLVATRWAGRLRPRIVLAANDGYLPGRTNFAARCAEDVDLVAWLRSLPFAPSPGAEYAHGHSRATGGSLPSAEFDELLAVLGLRT